MSDDAQPGAADDTPVVEVQPDVEPDESNDTFDRVYVEKLRKESATYRERANTLAARLHAALVAADGRLADPADLPYEATHLDDVDALTAAVTALLEARPHLRARRVTGDVGQGQLNRNDSVPSSFSDLFRT